MSLLDSCRFYFTVVLNKCRLIFYFLFFIVFHLMSLLDSYHFFKKNLMSFSDSRRFWDHASFFLSFFQLNVAFKLISVFYSVRFTSHVNSGFFHVAFKFHVVFNVMLFSILVVSKPLSFSLFLFVIFFFHFTIVYKLPTFYSCCFSTRCRFLAFLWLLISCRYGFLHWHLNVLVIFLLLSP